MSRQKARRESQLLDAATHLFREKGYHNTSMQDLADALGIQKASLYYYVESKEELLLRLLERGSSLLGARIDQIYAADLPPVEKLRRVLENHAMTVMEHLNLISVYIQEYRRLPPERLGEVLAERKHYEQVLMRILEDGIASGDFRPVNVKIVMLGVLGMLNWVHQWFSPAGELSPQEIATILTDLVLRGVLAGSGEGRD
ncbi:MAG TPA: TetR/AcrR family transcriptional regulator [Anaerolineales bacterium]|nr:TetR/AcrR family transcriptional regulator [Anaerolineae bacterium]HIQ00898.1 TetR/AcrR family transcriptional regulator [Anaerolineales bacterium]